MSNDEVYAAGLLIRALDPATQPSAIRAFMQAEIDVLDDIVSQGMTMIDIGCGTGRHLARLRDRVRIGSQRDKRRQGQQSNPGKSGIRPGTLRTANSLLAYKSDVKGTPVIVSAI